MDELAQTQPQDPFAPMSRNQLRSGGTPAPGYPMMPRNFITPGAPESPGQPNMGIALPPEVTPEMININVIPQSRLPEPAIQERARRYHELLGQSSPGPDVIANRVREGQELELRKEYTNRLQGQLNIKRNDLVLHYINYAKSRGAVPNEQDVQSIRNLTSEEFGQAAGSPETFFERLYARRTTELVRPESPNIPSATDSIIRAGENAAASRMYAANKLEEVEAIYGQASWARTFALHGLQLIPGLTWYNLGGTAERLMRTRPGLSAGDRSWLLGNSLYDQMQYYYSLPPDQAREALDRTLDHILSSPDGAVELDAMLLLQYIASPGSLEKFIANASSILDIATVLPYGTIGRAFGGRGSTTHTPPNPAPRAPGGPTEPIAPSPKVTSTGAGTAAEAAGADPLTAARSVDNSVSMVISDGTQETLGKALLIDDDLRPSIAYPEPVTIVGYEEAQGRRWAVFFNEQNSKVFWPADRIDFTPNIQGTASAQVHTAAAVHTSNPAAVIEGAGNIPAAAVRSAAELIEDQTLSAGPRAAGAFSELRHTIRSLFDLEGLVQGSSLNFRNELAQRLTGNAEAMLRLSVLNPLDIRRLPRGGQAEVNAMNEAWDILRKQYNNISDRIVDVAVSLRGVSDVSLDQFPKNLHRYVTAAGRHIEPIFNSGQFTNYWNFRQLWKTRNEATLEVSKLTNTPVTYNRRKGVYEFSGAPPRLSADPDMQGELRKALYLLDDAEIRLGQSKVNRSGMSTAQRNQFAKAAIAEENLRQSSKALNFDLAPFGDLPFPTPMGRQKLPSNAFNVIDGLNSTRFIEARILNRDGSLYSSFDEAVNDARVMNLPDFNVKPQGTGWHITVSRPIDETADVTRQGLQMDIQTDPLKTPQSVANQFLKYARSWTYKTSKELGDDLRVAAYGGSHLQQTLSRTISDVLEGKTALDAVTGRKSSIRMSAQEQKQFSDFIEVQKDYMNPLTQERGRFSFNQAELERDWHTQFSEMPSLNSSTAYWTWVQLNDLNFAVLNLNLWSEKVRRGWEIVRFTLGDKSPTPITSEGIFASGLEARAITKMPDRHPDWNAGVLIWDKNPSNVRFMRYGRSGLPKDAIENVDNEIAKLQGQGYVIYHVQHLPEGELAKKLGIDTEAVLNRLANRPATRPVSVDFILARDVQTAPLPVRQVPYRAGGNIEYPHRHYIKQPDIRGDVYFGDTVIHGVHNSKDAARLAEIYDTSRQHLRDFMKAVIPEEITRTGIAWLTYASKNLHVSPAEFQSWFINGRLSINNKITSIPGSKRIYDIQRGDIPESTRDLRANPYHFYNQIYSPYALERSEPLTEANRVGSHSNPVYNIQPASMIPALPTLRRAMNYMMSNRYLGDLQTKAGEFFTAEFGDLINASKADIFRNPARTIVDESNFPFKTGIPDRQRMSAAENARSVIKNFLSIRSEAEHDWLSTEAKLADWMATEGRAQSVVKLVEPSLMTTVRSPVQAMKNFLYRFQLMNPKQLLVQASGTAMVAAWEGPTTALKSYSSTLYSMSWLKTAQTSEMLSDFARRLTPHGWRPAEFIESHNSMLRTGFHNVGKEYGHRADFVQMETKRSSFGQILDAGMAPFRWGEEFARVTSWHAAYLSWRKTVGRNVPLDDAAVRSILSRASFLNGHMSAAEVADWQKHWLAALPTTFWSYQTRIFEQFLDFNPTTRMSLKQKGMALMTYGLMFGMPAAAGILAVGVPVVTMTNNALTDKGLSTKLTSPSPLNTGGGEDVILQGLLNGVIHGFLSTGIEAATGTQFNVAESMALGSSRIWTDIVRDRTALEMLFGAYSNTASDSLAVMNPFLYYLLDSFSSKPVGMTLRWQDFANVLTAQPGLSHAQRAYYALTLQQYFDKNGTSLGDLTGFESWMFALTGMQPQEYSQMFGVLRNEAQLRELQIKHMRSAQRYFNEMLAAEERKDVDAAREANARLRMEIIFGGWREDQKMLVFQRLVRGSEDRLYNVMRRYGQRGDDHQRLYETIMQNRYRGQ